MGYGNWEIYVRFVIGFMMIFKAPVSIGDTDLRDVFAINSLYAALGFPPLPGWIPIGGDPCADNWQGVECVYSNITAIRLNGANLGGELGDNLNFFSSVITIDLSGNHIGGSIPSNLPLTVRNFFLSANQFTGSVPGTLSSLSQLSVMSLDNNHLTGGIPDAFQLLTGLTNLDLSGNNLSGQLPPSMENLSSLTTLHLQNNQISGMLDVLQDLPLVDLNIENNLFSGPIPGKLLNIPNFRKDGNPFNTTILPSPPVSTPSLSPSGAPACEEAPGIHANGPSPPETPIYAHTSKFLTKKRVIGVAFAGVLIFIALGIFIFMSRCRKGRQVTDRIPKRHDMGPYNVPKEKLKYSESFLQQNNQIEKVTKEAVVRPQDGHGTTNHRRMDPGPKPDIEQEINGKRMAVISRHKEDHRIGMTGMDVNLKQPPPPLPLLPAERITVNPRVPIDISAKKIFIKNLNPQSSVRLFTIASLQQYTNSFSQANLIGGGMVGSVYRGELPDGRLVAIKKLDAAASRSNDEFLELVSSISKLQHPNVVELMGYCAEHGQQLLVYEYCRNGTLHDALHFDDEIHEKLSWGARIRIALGAARALEYLHEVCQAPIVHRNFRSANILLDDKLSVRVSDCGLDPLISSGAVSQRSGHLLSAHGYGAPEFELGSYTHQSDIYSFGVVMLELLTGRKSFDRSRPRGEQFLVRWAIPQLHDIDSLSRMVDPSLNGAYPSKSLSRFADIISLCVQAEPEFRPPMSEIVQNLLYMIQTSERKPSKRSVDE